MEVKKELSPWEHEQRQKLSTGNQMLLTGTLDPEGVLTRLRSIRDASEWRYWEESLEGWGIYPMTAELSGGDASGGRWVPCWQEAHPEQPVPVVTAHLGLASLGFYLIHFHLSLILETTRYPSSTFHFCLRNRSWFLLFTIKNLDKHNISEFRIQNQVRGPGYWQLMSKRIRSFSALWWNGCQ